MQTLPVLPGEFYRGDAASVKLRFWRTATGQHLREIALAPRGSAESQAHTMRRN